MPEKLSRKIAVDARGVALGGLDPVSYFRPAGPTPGSATRTESFGGATWQFASDANRAAFVEHPEKFVPQFGGHCVLGASRGQAFPGSPRAWKVIDDRLYLSINRFVGAVMGPSPARIAKAESMWATAS